MTLQLAYYADDFTGSTDALEFLTRAGARAMLFLDTPTPEQIESYGGLDAIGVAGLTRSMSTEGIEETLRRDFAQLARLHPRHVHYKVCSTFDSSPRIGSIGKAIEVGVEVFGTRCVPLLVAAPALGRYCAFGNLFARMGIGSQGDIHRLDRHPAMRSHPVTPASESDLRRHLAQQTTKRIGLFDILALELATEARNRNWQAMRDAGEEIALFDGMYPRHLAAVGELLEENDEAPQFCVGSSGIEMALGMVWEEMGMFEPRTNFAPIAPSRPLLVLSGSCSPVTEAQIRWALANGFESIALDTGALANPETRLREIERVVGLASSFLLQGRSLVAHTALGPFDPRIESGRERLAASGLSNTAEVLGTALGLLALGCVEKVGLRRVLLAGGDSSSYAGRAMGVEALEMIAPLAPGAPLCRVLAAGKAVNGLEINFKGGQVGGEDYFGQVSRGTKL